MAKTTCAPVRWDVAEPVESGRFEDWVFGEADCTGGGGRKAASDSAGNESDSLLLQPFDQLLPLPNQPVHPSCLPVQKVRNSPLLSEGHLETRNRAKYLQIQS